MKSTDKHLIETGKIRLPETINYFVIFCLSILFISAASAQRLHLKYRIPKDSIKAFKADLLKEDHHIKLKMPESVIVIKDDTLDERGQKPVAIAGAGKVSRAYLPTRNSEGGGAVLLTDGAGRESSGTSWQPASSLTPRIMSSSGKWNFLFDGSLFLRYTNQSGLRGGSQSDAPNWFSGTAERMLGVNSQIMFRTVVSLERLTEGSAGYPLLLQSGESGGITDRQSPRDLFTELSGAISTKISGNLSGYIYAGYPGEPALGPPDYMFRESSLYIPETPIGYNFQDAPNVSYGVVTLGLAYNNFKVEGSVFNGSEPDQNKYNFDKIKFNSYSGRVFYNPTHDLSLQFSAGRLTDPEGNGLNVNRTTASILYTKRLGGITQWSSSLIWGEKQDSFAGRQESFLFESSLSLPQFAVYGRVEFAQKPERDLGIAANAAQKETVGLFTLGVNKKLFSLAGLNFRIGAEGTLYGLPQTVRHYYGNNLISYGLYILINPSEML